MLNTVISTEVTKTNQTPRTHALVNLIITGKGTGKRHKLNKQISDIKKIKAEQRGLDAILDMGSSKAIQLRSHLTRTMKKGGSKLCTHASGPCPRQGQPLWKGTRGIFREH